ncbi:hypothetical protein DAPPUDRAFT_334786 [Daphnia pulex]|uniref:Uncharacterized protein n=1 Tax=Daphnia pulex TaxID=6669 RepID=E9HWD3_DAPPU|nr:hypothetical protein DAPPUDRAFT_334786 [Daphnia pulex]|eukprot:EFX63945.1 hypothetical protein DAPPUDRAFT_334786 [Daphnia pulex]
MDDGDGDEEGVEDETENDENSEVKGTNGLEEKVVEEQADFEINVAGSDNPKRKKNRKTKKGKQLKNSKRPKQDDKNNVDWAEKQFFSGDEEEKFCNSFFDSCNTDSD